MPEPLVEAVRSDNYDRGDCEFTTTELISPPRIAKLRQQHWNQLSEDASDRIFILLGKSVHTILEHSASDRYVIEKRFFFEHDGAKISGQIDLYEIATKRLQDWKVTSRHTTSDGAKPEWIAQANVNRLILEANGLEVAGIDYVAIYRDYSKLAAAREADYPEHQVEVLELPLWPEKQAREYLSYRIKLHRDAEKELPLCTPEERWEKPTRWALMKEGQKRAIKLFESAELAEAARSNVKQYVESRPGESTRCLYYCPCVSFCSFGRELLREKMEKAA